MYRKYIFNLLTYFYKTESNVLPNSLKMKVFMEKRKATPAAQGLLRLFVVTLCNRYNYIDTSYFTGIKQPNPIVDYLRC